MGAVVTAISPLERSSPLTRYSIASPGRGGCSGCGNSSHGARRQPGGNRRCQARSAGSDKHAAELSDKLFKIEIWARTNSFEGELRPSWRGRARIQRAQDGYRQPVDRMTDRSSCEDRNGPSPINLHDLAESAAFAARCFDMLLAGMGVLIASRSSACCRAAPEIPATRTKT